MLEIVFSLHRNHLLCLIRIRPAMVPLGEENLDYVPLSCSVFFSCLRGL